MSTKGYAGYAIGEVTGLRHKMAQTKTGPTLIYELSVTLTQRIQDKKVVDWDDPFETDDYRAKSKYTFWMNPVAKEGKDKSAMEVAGDIIKDVFDYEVKERDDFMPDTLNERLKGKKVKCKCEASGDEGQYTDIKAIYNPEYQAKGVSDEDKDSINSVLDAFFA